MAAQMVPWARKKWTINWLLVSYLTPDSIGISVAGKVGGSRERRGERTYLGTVKHCMTSGCDE
jgi:hypothetical protein